MSNPFENSPFGGAAVETTTEAAVVPTEVVATVAPTEVVTTTVAPSEVTTEGDGPKKQRKPRKETNRRKTQEEVKFILENYATRSPSDIGKELGLTRQQVYRTVRDARKAYLDKAETLPADKAEAVKAWVEKHLPAKTEEFGKGGGKRGSMVENMFDDIFGEIL